MNDLNSIPRDELLELALVDALGLLDEVESARFERGFLAAPPGVQAEIRALQDRVAADRLLLSDDQPPASLRLRTLARVAAAIETQAGAIAPIAVIGPSRAQRATAPEALDRESRDQIVREILERSALERLPTQHLWRAAALFLFAALAVTLYFHIEQRRVSHSLMAFVDQRMTEQELQRLAEETLGLDFDFATARALDVYIGDLTAAQIAAAPAKAHHVHAYLAADSKSMYIFGLGGCAPGAPVSLATGSDAARVVIGSTVVETRGFRMQCPVPSHGGPMQLRVGEQTLTIQI